MKNQENKSKRQIRIDKLFAFSKPTEDDRMDEGTLVLTVWNNELRDIKRDREIKRKGGQADKQSKGIFQAVKKIVQDNPDISAFGVWQKLSDYDSSSSLEINDDVDYDIYIDGDDLFQENLTTGNKKSIKRSSLDRYVTKAKRLIQSQQ